MILFPCQYKSLLGNVQIHVNDSILWPLNPWLIPQYLISTTYTLNHIVDFVTANNCSPSIISVPKMLLSDLISSCSLLVTPLHQPAVSPGLSDNRSHHQLIFSFLSLNSMVNHTLFPANILDFLLCLPSTLSFGFITSQSNFNSLQPKVAEEKYRALLTCIMLKIWSLTSNGLLYLPCN